MESNIIQVGCNKFISEKETISNHSFLFHERNDYFLSINDSPPPSFSRYNDNSFSLADGCFGEFMADEVINKNKIYSNEISSNENKSLNFNEKKEKPDLLDNRDNNEKDQNKNKTENINTTKDKNNSCIKLFEVYPKKEHNKYNKDNIKDKIIRSFLNNIYKPTECEIYRIKKRNKSLFKNKIFTKLTSILIFFQKFKLENLFKLKTKNIFYSDEILKMFNKKELTEKYKIKKKENNYKNKALLKEIKDKGNDEIKDEEVKKRINNINEIMDKPLYEMYKIYLLNDKRYESFNTLVDDMIKLEKNDEDEKYIKRYEDVAKSLLNDIDEIDLNKEE